MFPKSCVLIIYFLVATRLFAQPHPFTVARWISPAYQEDSLHPCPVFQKTFRADKKIRKAIAYITAHGLYEANLNGNRVGDAWFTPGYTSYDHRLQYQDYDITKLLHPGNNVLTVTIGDGWWRGIFGGRMQANNYGKEAGLLFQLDIIYTDGTQATIISDKSWQSATGLIRFADLYNGEVDDLRIKPKNWTGVLEREFPFDNLAPTIGAPVTKQERFKPVKIFTDHKGEQVVDFGQNMAGWVQLKVKGRAGDTIQLSHAEALDLQGNFYTGNLREAKATDMYILKEGWQTLEPHFTYHGFRYAKVEGFKATKGNCTAIALHSALRRVGHFSCSNPLINQLQHNIEWSLNGNFLDIPTDCPQRSERLGWTGDAQIFCRTAAFNCNVKDFYKKWLQDLKADQGTNGGLPNIVPDIYGHNNKGNKRGVAGWGDAATIIPWTLYELYGDKKILEQQYASMKAWVDYIRSVSKDDLWTAKGYGDWYAPGDSTSLPFIDQCFFAHSAGLLIRAARVLQQTKDAEDYSALLDRIKKAFLGAYIDSNGRAITHTQTAYTLALQFGLLPDSLQTKAVNHLVDLIHAKEDHLATGFLGTPYLLQVLTNHGYTDLAYTILNQTSPPSWLYPITKGATTIWEKWKAIRPDGSFDTCSLNHYAYGAVGDWLYRTVAGIEPAAPGYQKLLIHPHPGGGLTWAKASYRCVYGTIVSNWKIRNGELTMHVEIPEHTDAIVYVPGKSPIHIGPGVHEFKTRIGIQTK